MKKLNVTICCSLLLLCGCQTDGLQESIVEGQVFTAFLEECQTKTYLEKGNLLRWNEDDRISLFAGNTLNSEYRFDGRTGDNSGTFSPVDDSYGTGNDLACNYAVYPYMAYTEITESGVIYFYLPSHQKYAENSFGPGANTMVAVTKDVDDRYLSFKNVCGYIKISLYGSGVKVRSITFTGNGGERISGDVKISVTDPDNPTVTTTRDAESVVVLNCGEEGVDIGDSEEDATAFWVVLPPKTFSNGFSVSILTSDDREIVKSTKKSVTVERNVILPMKAFEISVLPEVVPDYQWYVDASGDEYLVGNAEELVALAKLSRGDADALAATGEEAAVTFGGKLVSLTGDIDLAVCCGEASATSWEPIENFMGTLDGNGYTISNLYCNKNGRMGLFDSIEDAKITDLAVEGKIGRSFQGDEPSSVRVGGFVASARNSTFENCVSGVSVETAGISSTCPIALTVGGVCGHAYSCAFIACRSFASINDRQGEWEYTYFLGGVVGYAESCMVVACMNLGDEVVQANSQAYSYVGGVVGYMQYGDATRIYSCYSSANVAGRQPGQILGAYGTYVGKPNIVASYYSGPSYKGVGSKFYGGNEYSYDYGTSKCTDAAAAVDEMNAGIDQWNESFTDWPCNYEFTLDSDGQLMLVFR